MTRTLGAERIRASALRPDVASAGPLRLAVGAVSRAAVDAACDVAAHFGRPVYIVASRSQVGSFASRPGYVSDWCMRDLVEHLRQNGRRSHAIVLRDHGGPLQHAEDGSPDDLPEALNRACAALAADVRSGADGVHLDLGAWIGAGGASDEGLRRLVAACEEAADGRALHYEIGVDPQSGAIADVASVEEHLDAVRGAIPATATAAFIVVQLGTLVVEDRNVGVLETMADKDLRTVAEAAAVVRRGGLLPKAHNCDYLSPWALHVLGRAGVHCNIAPQYAVAQNRLLARLVELFAAPSSIVRVGDVVRATGGWRRWTEDREPTRCRAVELGAHYAMSGDVIQEVLVELDAAAGDAKLPGFDELARRSLRQLMLQHAATLEGVGVPCR